MRKLKKKYLVIILIIGVIIIGGISYALWQITHESEENNKITSGCFEMEFVELTNSVNLNNSYPISDTKGLKTDPYTFTIKNNCTIYGEYTITLDIVDTNTDINLDKIKIAMDGAKTVNPTILTTLDTNENNEQEIRTSYILASDKASVGGKEKTYNFRMWIDESATTSIEDGVMGKGIEARLTITSVAKTKVIPTYSASFSSEAEDFFVDGTLTVDDGYIVVGATSAITLTGDLQINHKGILRGYDDALIIKYDIDGNLEWSNSFGSSGFETFNSIIQITDGGFIAVGYTNATSANGDFLTNHKGTLRGGNDGIIVKYDVNGNFEWSNSFGSTAHDFFLSGTITSDGGIIATGDTTATAKSGDLSLASYKGTLRGGTDGLIVKFDVNGNLEWSNSFGSSATERFNLVATTSDGAIIVAGYTQAVTKSGDFLTNHKGTLRGSSDALIVRYSSNGNLEWSNNFGSSAGEEFFSISLTEDGGIIASGHTSAITKSGDFLLPNYKGTLRGGVDGLIVRYESNGNIEWSNSFGSTADEYFRSITLTSDGGYIAVGSTAATAKTGDFLLSSYKGTLRGDVDGLIVKYDENSSLEWSNNFGSSSADTFYSITATNDGGYIAFGFTRTTTKNGDFLINHKGTIMGSISALIAKYSDKGELK